MAKRKISATVDLKVRMKEPLRAAVEAAANRRGISMNAEAVDRLERSFEREGLLFEVLKLAYGPKLGAILIMLGTAMQAAGRSASRYSTGRSLRVEVDWVADAYGYDHATKAAVRLLEAMQPSGTAEAPQLPPAIAKFFGEDAENFDRWGEDSADRRIAEAVDDADLAKMLGPEIVERLRARVKDED